MRRSSGGGQVGPPTQRGQPHPDIGRILHRWLAGQHPHRHRWRQLVVQEILETYANEAKVNELGLTPRSWPAKGRFLHRSPS